jgi:DNA (cytosine-5)-methyltransferase 1
LHLNSRKEFSIWQEIIVDNFAGGGGASTGISLAIGRSVDVAINHDPAAIAMHKANHPDTEHYTESVWDIDPLTVTGGRSVALCWFSPDCKHFSKAKGGKPVEKHIRGLAWVAVRWAAVVKPRVIMLENVEEFKTWGPLLKSGLPDPDKKGRTFQVFVNALKRLGYQVGYKELRACDYGAPTIRKRFFLIARRDKMPITWPKPTHGDPNSMEVKSGKLKPWRTAAEIINWSLRCPSIFERKRPLAENTMRRIARGIKKFVIDCSEPFIVNYKFGNDPESIKKPLSTITAVNSHYIVAPTLIQYHGEQSGAVVRGQALQKPIMVVDSSPRYALISSFLAKHYGGGYTGSGAVLNKPVPTVTTVDHNALVTSHLVKFKGTNIGQPVTDPIQTITAGGLHFGEVRAFLMKYYGTGEGQSVNEPLHTVPTKDRFGLVAVHGQDYQIVDIGMRMLEPRELFDAQGFPPDYVIDIDCNGKKYPKSAQVARCGNAVPPPFAEALVRVNLPELCYGEDTVRAAK